jgi:peptide/nickel transport system permease protein
VSRAAVLSVTSRPYVRAAIAMGGTDRHIIVRHVLPNIAGPIVVLTAITVAGAILVGSALSFLGLGAPPPSPEWGVMLNDARAYMQHGWWLTVMPGVAIALSVLALNLLGDGMRDVLDPTSRATDTLA